MSDNKNNKRTLEGVVVSDKMDKTVVVRVDVSKKHPRYGKYYRVSKKYKAHDAKNEYHVDDRVRIAESRPLSKDKRWIVTVKVEVNK